MSVGAETRRADECHREGIVAISATVSEAIANAFENAKTLLVQGSSVVVTDIAGAGFEPATSGL